VSRKLDLMGTHEIAKRLGVSRARADQLLRQKGAPDPVAVLRQGRVWLKRDVEAWMRKIGRA
jgi:predicted DNA-binding transcriptional regulator AlpA